MQLKLNCYLFKIDFYNFRKLYLIPKRPIKNVYRIYMKLNENRVKTCHTQKNQHHSNRGNYKQKCYNKNRKKIKFLPIISEINSPINRHRLAEFRNFSKSTYVPYTRDPFQIQVNRKGWKKIFHANAWALLVSGKIDIKSKTVKRDKD